MNPQAKKKRKTENEGDIPKERDPKPIPFSQVVAQLEIHPR